jgi:hypothetical protein
LRCGKVDPRTFTARCLTQFFWNAFSIVVDGIVILKMLPEGPARCTHTLRLLFVWLSPSQKEYVLAAELYRSAEQSGISIRGLAKEYERPPLRGSRWPGERSNYSLNSEGLATAKEIMATGK